MQYRNMLTGICSVNKVLLREDIFNLKQNDKFKFYLGKISRYISHVLKQYTNLNIKHSILSGLLTKLPNLAHKNH